MSIRLADGSAICAACYQQRPELRYVDFDANWDGPAFTNEHGYPQNQVDDLILCEACVNAAATVLNVRPQPMADLERENARLKAEAIERHRYLEQLEDLIPRRPGRPKKTTVGVV